MEEKENKSKIKVWLGVGFVIVISVTVIYFQRNFNKKEELAYEKQVSVLKEKLSRLDYDSKILKKTNFIVNYQKDSLKRNLDFLWVYKTVVQTARLRDQIGEKFDFTPGDVVRMKCDSSLVVVTDVITGGNQYNYYVRFLVKNKKGLSFEVSPLELAVFK